MEGYNRQQEGGARRFLWRDNTTIPSFGVGRNEKNLTADVFIKKYASMLFSDMSCEWLTAIKELAEGKTVIDKPTFGSMVLPQYIKGKGTPDAIFLVGICTDICVISNAMILKAAFPETEIYVDSLCCAGTTPQNHENALNAMKMCQINILD